MQVDRTPRPSLDAPSLACARVRAVGRGRRSGAAARGRGPQAPGSARGGGGRPTTCRGRHNATQWASSAESPRRGSLLRPGGYWRLAAQPRSARSSRIFAMTSSATATGTPSQGRCRRRIHLLMRRWSVPGSNRRPPACKAGALPTELTPRRHEDSGIRRRFRQARWRGRRGARRRYTVNESGLVGVRPFQRCHSTR